MFVSKPHSYHYFIHIQNIQTLHGNNITLDLCEIYTKI